MECAVHIPSVRTRQQLQLSVSEQQQVTLLTNADVGDSELCRHVLLMELELEVCWMAWSSFLPMTVANPPQQLHGPLTWRLLRCRKTGFRESIRRTEGVSFRLFFHVADYTRAYCGTAVPGVAVILRPCARQVLFGSDHKM